jgi:protein O-mannosyl-transferase
MAQERKNELRRKSRLAGQGRGAPAKPAATVRPNRAAVPLDPTAAPPRRATVVAICVLLVAATFAVFGQTLGHEFVNCDDDQYVFDNPRVPSGLTGANVAWAFTEPYSANWHPLTWLSHMLDCQIYQLRPWGHHLTNVLLHAAASAALLLALLQLTGAVWRSGMAAALFAIHPLHVESVAWVAERKDVLSGLLFMLLLLAYAAYAKRPFCWWRYALVVVCYAMGLMAKSMLVTAPCVLLLLDFWPLRRWDPLRALTPGPSPVGHDHEYMVPGRGEF